MTLVLLAEYSDPIAADAARLALDDAGIDAVIFDAGMASLGLGMLTPARLMVLDEDLAAARAVLGAAR